MQRKDIFILCGILILALAVRLFLFARIAPNDHYAAPWYIGEGGDAASYSTIAANIASGNGFSLNGAPTAYRPPLYPFFLAGVYKMVGGENPIAARAAQIALAVLTLWLFWLLARRVTGSVPTAHLATFVLALHPKFVIFNLVLLTETLFFALLAAALLALVFWHEQKAFARRPLSRAADAALPRNASRSAASTVPASGGVAAREPSGGSSLDKPTASFRGHAASAAASGALALATLTKPSILPFAALAAIWIGYTAGKRLAARTLIIPLAIFVMLVGVWTFRNWKTFDAFFLVTTNSGYTIAESWDRTILEPLGISNRDILAPYKGLDDRAFANLGYKIFIDEIKKDPVFIAGIVAKKFIYWWNPFVKSPSALIRWGHAALTTLAWILGAWGLYLAGKQRGWKLPSLFLLLFAVSTAVHTLTLPYHRYRFPVMDPYFILFGSYAITYLWNRRVRIAQIS